MAEERSAERLEAEADDRLMVAVQQGELGRLGALFERHHRALFNFFLRLTGDREASEDLVQEVFVRILRYRSTYQPGTQFRAWMYQMARHAHIDRFKSRRRELPLDEDAADPIAELPAPIDAIEQQQQAALVREALARLPDDKREVLVLTRFQGLKYDQVGRLLGCEVGTVKVRVFRAVRALRIAYERVVAESGGLRRRVIRMEGHTGAG